MTLFSQNSASIEPLFWYFDGHLDFDILTIFWFWFESLRAYFDILPLFQIKIEIRRFWLQNANAGLEVRAVGKLARGLDGPGEAEAAHLHSRPLRIGLKVWNNEMKELHGITFSINSGNLWQFYDCSCRFYHDLDMFYHFLKMFVNFRQIFIKVWQKNCKIHRK